jgi:aldehyde dehydrogenase (NAD+)
MAEINDLRVADRALGGTGRGHGGYLKNSGLSLVGVASFTGSTIKQSGIRREGGTEGLLPFLETKSVILEGPSGWL